MRINYEGKVRNLGARLTFHHNIFLTCSLSCIVAASGRPSDTLAIIVNKTILSEVLPPIFAQDDTKKLFEIALPCDLHPPQATSAKLFADVAGFSSARPLSTYHVSRSVDRFPVQISLGREIGNFPVSSFFPRPGTRRKKRRKTLLLAHVVFFKP